VKGDSQLIIKQVHGECRCNEPRLVAYLLHVRKLEKDFTALELQHVPRANNLAADDLSVKASTWASVPEGIFKRRLVAEPPELFQLKCLSHASGVVTHLNRNNPSVPQI
jgi:hypothetical protein